MRRYTHVDAVPGGTSLEQEYKIWDSLRPSALRPEVESSGYGMICGVISHQGRASCQDD